ncbi:MAG: hypothetical protein H8F28_14565, partial [Fibrella sp.]|nr:hypothetical protein [Armatimonadota bacterium]
SSVGRQQIAPGLFAEIGHITRREVRWLADGTRVAYTAGFDHSPDTFGDSYISGTWLVENGKPSKRYAELEVYIRLRATSKKPARKMNIRIDRTPLTGDEKTDIKATVLFGDPAWKLGARATVSPVGAVEYNRLSAKQPVSGPWRDGAVVKTTVVRMGARKSDRLLAIDSLGKPHPANATQYHKTNTDKTLLVANFNDVPGRIRGYRWGRDVQERREIVFRGVALVPKPPATADSGLGEGRIPFYKDDMRRGQSIVLAKDAQGGETRLTFEKASIGNADVDWQSTRVSSVSLRWRVQVPPGVSPTLGGRPVLLLKKGRVQLPYGVGGIAERMPEGTTQENTRDFHVAPADVIALIYVPENTSFPGNKTGVSYPAPASFQPPKSTWQGRGMFRPVATIPFAAGRTFRATANGNVVAFTVQVTPETDPSWTMGRKTSPTAIVQTHDTGSAIQERRLLLIEKDGTVHEMMYGSFPVLNFVLDDLGAKAIGKPPVYADTVNGYKNWQSMTAQFPKTWIPRLKEIRLEARPSVEVPYTE